MLNRVTKITTPKDVQSPDSIGLMDFRCSEIISNMCGSLGSLVHNFTGGISFGQSSKDQSRLFKKKVEGFEDV